MILSVLGCEANVARSLDGLDCAPNGECADGYVCQAGKCLTEDQLPGSRREDAGRQPPQEADAAASNGTQHPTHDVVWLTGDANVPSSSSSPSASVSAQSTASGVCSGSCDAGGSTQPESTISREAFDAGGMSCEAGTCAGFCTVNLTRCSDACYDLATDVNHCGLCDRACTGPQEATIECRNRGCVVTCPESQKLCGDACVDTASDTNNCSDCGRKCVAPDKATATCDNSQCKIDCYDGYSMCDDVCVDFASDDAHCGDCFTVCKGNRVCVDGACQPR